MISSLKSVEILRDFGLTRNQAKVYITIARLKLASVGQISKVAKVRREDVYRILPKLEKMGLVEKLLGTPAKIRATPVEQALSILVKHEEDTARERVSALKTKTKTFLEYFARAPELEPEQRGNFALLSKREGILGKMLTIAKSAQKEFDIVCSGIQIMQFVHLFAEELKEIAKRGVKIRIISEPPEYEDSIAKVIEEHISPEAPVDLRYSDLPSGHYMIVDFREAMVSTTTEGNMAENPCLWTNSDSLVGVLQGNFENIWHNSISVKAIEKNAVPEKIISFMEKLEPTNHVIFVYDSPEAKYNVLFNYLKVGLDNGEAGVYVASDENPSQIREAMKRFGLDVEKHEKKQALHIFGYEDIYLVDGRFSIAITMNLWNKLYKEALKRGFKGLRVTGEMAWFFKHNLIQELIQYEKTLHRVLDIPMIAVCAYNADMLNRSNNPIDLYTELSRAHGTVLFTGIDNRLGRMEIRSL